MQGKKPGPSPRGDQAGPTLQASPKKNRAGSLTSRNRDEQRKNVGTLIVGGLLHCGGVERKEGISHFCFWAGRFCAMPKTGLVKNQWNRLFRVKDWSKKRPTFEGKSRIWGRWSGSKKVGGGVIKHSTKAIRMGKTEGEEGAAQTLQGNGPPTRSHKWGMQRDRGAEK